MPPFSVFLAQSSCDLSCPGNVGRQGGCVGWAVKGVQGSFGLERALIGSPPF